MVTRISSVNSSPAQPSKRFSFRKTWTCPSSSDWSVVGRRAKMGRLREMVSFHSGGKGAVRSRSRRSRLRSGIFMIRIGGDYARHASRRRDRNGRIKFESQKTRKKKRGLNGDFLRSCFPDFPFLRLFWFSGFEIDSLPLMKSVRLTQLGRPLEDVDVAVPEIGPADVLVRVAACGICHSDAHYRAGLSQIAQLPVTPGHEIAGTVESVGAEVAGFRAGDRICVHYLAHCGVCEFCRRGHEQFCPEVQMIGKHSDGGYAEFVKVPARSVFALPEEIPF